MNVLIRMLTQIKKANNKSVMITFIVLYISFYLEVKILNNVWNYTKSS